MCVTSPWRHHTLAARASACPCWAQAGARQSGRHGKLQEHNATSMTDLKRVMCCVRPAAATQDEMLGGEQSLVCSGGQAVTWHSAEVGDVRPAAILC